MTGWSLHRYGMIWKNSRTFITKLNQSDEWEEKLEPFFRINDYRTFFFSFFSSFVAPFDFFFLLFYLIFFSDTTIISLITVIVIVFSYWDNKNTILSLTLAIWIDMVLQTRELVSYCGKVNESIDGTSTLASPRNMAPQDPLYFLE